MDVFVGGSEVKLLAVESKIHGSGAFVFCSVPASSETEARKQLETALSEDGYRLVGFEWVRPADELGWESAEDRDRFRGLAAEGRRLNDVVYSDFYCW